MYWISEEVGGRGLATQAVVAAVGYAREVLEATDVFAGVTHGNAASVALLGRLGFVEVEMFASYARFHLPLRAGPMPD